MRRHEKKCKKSLKNHATLLVLLTILSCDSFKEDFIEPANQVILSKTEYYVLPGSSVVIDLESAVKQSYTTATLEISQNPLRGTLSQLDTLLLKYYPAREFLEGMDEFVFSVISNSEVIATETITIFMKQDVEELPCALYAAEDKVYARSGSTVSVKVLKNDRICGINDSPLQISIRLNPRFGEGKLVGDSIIVYTAGPEYKGRDELVYKLEDSSGENVSYGIINISEWEVQFFPTPITPISSVIGPTVTDVTEMFFVNDTTGHLGGHGIYKTTNGGATWKESYPGTDSRYSIIDIYFVDADHGYATYSRVGCGCYQGGLLRTIDGGDTWEKVELSEPNLHVGSVLFTSTTTGFISIDHVVDETNIYQSILKTDDGGITWKFVFSNIVFSTPPPFNSLNIRFADSKTGYAYDNSTMYRTFDGGETWIWAYKNEYIMSVAVTPEIIGANFTVGSLSETSPSTMFRSQDGKAWSPTINLPYAILAQEFSPSGDIGFAIGISAKDSSFDYPRSQTISIIKSVDRGATWTEVEITEPLYGSPFAVAFPSDTVAYVLGFREVIKFTRP